MNPNTTRDAWNRLVAGARMVRDDRDTSAPYGFSTRVAAIALASERRTASILDRLALRAVGIAMLLAVASIAINYRAITQTQVRHTVVEDEIQFSAVEDPVAVLLDA